MKLEESNYIIRDNFNKKRNDRTTWYSLGTKAIDLIDIDSKFCTKQGATIAPALQIEKEIKLKNKEKISTSYCTTTTKSTTIESPTSSKSALGCGITTPSPSDSNSHIERSENTTISEPTHTSYPELADAPSHDQEHSRTSTLTPAQAPQPAPISNADTTARKSKPTSTTPSADSSAQSPDHQPRFSRRPLRSLPCPSSRLQRIAPQPQPESLVFFNWMREFTKKYGLQWQTVDAGHAAYTKAAERGWRTATNEPIRNWQAYFSTMLLSQEFKLYRDYDLEPVPISA